MFGETLCINHRGQMPRMAGTDCVNGSLIKVNADQMREDSWGVVQNLERH